jgi:hypothetical protein
MPASRLVCLVALFALPFLVAAAPPEESLAERDNVINIKKRPLASPAGGIRTAAAPKRPSQRVHPPEEEPTPPQTHSLPPLRLVNKKQARIDFEVPHAGRSGLGSVDVYTTTDEGKTWEKAPADRNVTLPISSKNHNPGPVSGSVTVTLPSDGKVYGFYLVVKNCAGVGNTLPNPGDAPQVRIERDTVVPEAELHPIKPDPNNPSAVVLSWKAKDRNLASHPISLEWAPRREGPWTAIGEPHMANTGHYTWKVSEEIPSRVYLRLSVRDRAGNVAVAQTPGHLVIDLQPPEVPVIKAIKGVD